VSKLANANAKTLRDTETSEESAAIKQYGAWKRVIKQKVLSCERKVLRDEEKAMSTGKLFQMVDPGSSYWKCTLADGDKPETRNAQSV
jgi:hypothetical protein